MQNSTDASLLTSTAFQQSAAVAIADATTAFVG